MKFVPSPSKLNQWRSATKSALQNSVSKRDLPSVLDIQATAFITGNIMKKNTQPNAYTKVSSATSSKITTDITIDVNNILKQSKQNNIYVVSTCWKGSDLSLEGIFLGDRATEADVSAHDIVNGCDVFYDLEKVTSKKKVKAFIDKKISSPFSPTVYILKATREPKPKYKFIALSDLSNTEETSEVYMDDVLYFLSTDRACIDFLAASTVEELAC